LKGLRNFGEGEGLKPQPPPPTVRYCWLNCTIYKTLFMQYPLTSCCLVDTISKYFPQKVNTAPKLHQYNNTSRRRHFTAIQSRSFNHYIHTLDPQAGREFPTVVSNIMAEVIESLGRQRRVTVSQVYLYSGTEFS